NGVNHFEGRAVDDQGYVALTPASEDWTIAVTTLQVTITDMPGNPTFSRAAAFGFTGANSYECSLDGVAYAACGSPQTYSGLSDGLHTFLVRGLDGSGNKGAATRFVWQVQNQLPVASDQLITTFRDTPVAITLTAEDSDDLTYRLVDLPVNGVVGFTTPPNGVTYSPDSGFAGVDSFTFEALDAVGKSNLATVTVVTNFEPTITTGAAVATVQYSDGITPVTITIDDLDSPGNTLTLVASNLPEPLTLTRVTDNGDAIPGQSVWTLAGTADLVVGTYVVTLVADDGVGGAITGDPVVVVIDVVPEDVMVRFHGGNPRAVQVQQAGDVNSGPFNLRVDVKELYPDSGTSVLAGDISQANVSMQLVPIGPGGSVAPTGCTTELHDVDYNARLTLTCGFDVVAINTYAVEVTVGGMNYAGYDEDVVTIYDPARGFTTGGSTLNWPGASGGEVSFGFGMEYNKKGKNLRGQLMVKRQLDDGSVFRLKSNALDALALGTDQSSGFSWATFSGKANVYSSATDSTEGNYTFIVYVEDHGAAGDTFWLQVKNKDGAVVDQLSLAEPAASNAAVITSGDIVVPAGQVRSADSGDDSTADDPNAPLQETPAEESPAVEDEATGNDEATEHAIFLPLVQR
ncbi:MAG: Ig-like domain-containing protein, partial [Caldilineaceae bacterium]|nr:Ig-like domain-containing protein [Caldilineaceae bacterium]